MSNAEGASGSGPGRPGQDPVTGFFLAMRDAWLAAARTENRMMPSMSGGNVAAGNLGTASPGGTSPTANLLAPMMGVLGAMADFTAAARQRLDQPGTGPAAHP